MRGLGVGLALALTTALPLSADAAPKRVTAVSVAPSASVLTSGAKLVLTGQASPRTRRVVAIQRLSGSRWVQVAKGWTLADGRYSGSLSTAAVGTFRYRAYVYADARNQAAVSRTVAVRIAAKAATNTPSSVSAGAGVAPGAFSYLMGTQKYRWDPCTPITYAVNPDGAPAGWEADVTGALQRLTASSGLQFRSVGTTTAVPTTGSYTSPAQLLIAYVTPGESDLITVAAARNGQAGMGGGAGTMVDTASGVQGELTRGEVALNVDVIRGLPAGFGAGNSTGYVGTRGQLLMHELAHAMGLGHVNDTREIMYPMMGAKAAAWGPGDVAGLTSVGSKAGCITPLAPKYGRLKPTEPTVKVLD